MVSYLDLILLIPIGWAIWKGWQNGFVIEVFSALSIFVGIYLGIHLSDWMSAFLREKFDIQSDNLPIISFLVILILVVVGLFFLSRLITKSVKAGGGETWNKVGGAVFSLTKFLLTLSVLFILFNSLDAKYDLMSEEQKKKSYFYEPIYNFSLVLLPAFEESEFYKKLKQEHLAPVTNK
jgi:membrane protein required for colicin V production